MQSHAANQKLIIGIDFGVAYALRESQMNEMPPIRSLAVDQTIAIPSRIAYDRDGTCHWGQDAQDAEGPVFSWIKLFLYDPHHPILQDLSNAGIPVLPDQSTSDQLIEDFFRFGSSPRDRVFYASEAEAAALYLVQHSLGDLMCFSLRYRRRVYLCKDVAGFVIYAKGPNPFYDLFSRDSGIRMDTRANCGGAAMDAAIINYLKNEHPDFFPAHSERCSGLLTGIEELKHNFDGEETLTLKVEDGAFCSHHVIRPEDMMACLNPTIDEIIGLILRNMEFVTSGQRSLIQLFLLVGGPSQVPYLEKRIRTQLPSGSELQTCKGYIGLRGPTAPRLVCDTGYALAPFKAATIRVESRTHRIQEVDPNPYWFLEEGKVYETPYSAKHSFNLFYPHDGSLRTHISILARNTKGTRGSPDDGIRKVAVIACRLDVVNFTDALHAGAGHCIRVERQQMPCGYDHTRKPVRMKPAYQFSGNNLGHKPRHLKTQALIYWSLFQPVEMEPKFNPSCVECSMIFTLKLTTTPTPSSLTGTPRNNSMNSHPTSAGSGSCSRTIPKRAKTPQKWAALTQTSASAGPGRDPD
ncbi:hypothetical protein BO78DRAFT_424406 [Aspergillus sclerotiicarbonarius CBS 121057]|uniref:Actin-like ATPase domain-containing protein n=1 Tax=Aspergillus sclerotiicarbonarius (strain CBS 121057 / IBT 28362) TaxID=1448318 RepID=A0A319DSE7_ASPSB|nr:hypothetical protein BO78DRAFT_424406 [Aspergillus sclerotiicarbonarius CBS 121057]